MNAFKQLVDFLQAYAKSPILNPPATPGDLSEVEDIVGHKLPEYVRAAYRLGNGEAELAERTEYDRDPGIFAGKSFYPTQVIIEEELDWRMALRSAHRFAAPALLYLPTSL